jgi:chemotaxis protein MotB
VSTGSTRSGHDRWLLSYADLMTLLFAFFMTLYAAAEARNAPAPRTGDIHLPVESAEVASDNADAAPLDPTADVRRELELHLAEAIGDGRIEITNDARGLILSLPESATFASGSAEVSKGALEVLRQVADVLASTSYAVRVEGHTDDQPIRTSLYRSNWELSTARASAVVAFFIESAGIDPARLSAAGYGEHHPRAANDSAASRARNRRVDIVVY